MTEEFTQRPRRSVLTCAAMLMTAVLATPAQAVDATWSGFATLGYTESNSDYTYQRFIDRDGTLKRDSLLAGQVDLRLAPQWSATLQVRAAPADNHDDRWRAEASWAFVAWRPDNDWLVRAGKLRVPLYLYSESLDVGVSHDMVRLPHEIYSISPSNEFTGLFLTRGLTVGTHDVSVDAYAGKSDTQTRLWARDGLPPLVSPGSFLSSIRVKVAGLVLTARESDVTWRLGLHAANVRRADGSRLAVRFPRVDLAPGVGYWQVDNSIPGPGVPSVASVRNVLLSAGVDWQIGGGWRVSGELASIRQFDTELGSESVAGYVALFKRIGDFTPYTSLARQKSSAETLRWAKRLLTPGLPAQVPGAAQINAMQRLAGENGYAYDQDSIALGVSWALSPAAKLKAEWMRTRVGAVSYHFDTPAGRPGTSGLRVNSLAVNFSVAF